MSRIARWLKPRDARARRVCATSWRTIAAKVQFRLLVESVIDYAIYMLDPDGIVSSWNLGAQRIKGYLPEEIVGQHFSKFYTEEDRAAGLPQRGLDRARREGRFESEGWRVRKDGTRFRAHVVIDAIPGEDGEVIGFAKITARRHRAARGRSGRWSRRGRRCSSRRSWKRSASSPAVSRTTSTTC